MKTNFLLLVFTIIILQACTKISVPTVTATDISVFNEAPHNAFTDLIKYNSEYYCVFREASGHNSLNGKLRIVKSVDSKTWSNFDLLSISGKDLRDPHFFIDNQNLLCVGTNDRDANNNRENIIYKLVNNAFIQSNPVAADNDYWFWAYSRLRDTLYSIGYNVKQVCFNSINSSKPKIMLFKNSNASCTDFNIASSNNWINNSFNCPCESSVIFTSDTTAVAIVRDEHTPGESHIGTSRYPFANWKWQTFPHFLVGPKLALLPDGRIFLCAGAMAYYDKTYYAILNPHNFSIEKMGLFQSGVESGYPGVIIEGTTALISYYSSHEGNARVYIERIAY